jgi:hypothetical protein
MPYEENRDDTNLNGNATPNCKQSRKWQNTIPKEPSGALWKPAEDLMDRFVKLKTKYKCWADHIGRKTGYKHYHCDAWFKNPQKERIMQNKFSMTNHMMHGDDYENTNYICKKGANTSLQEIGHKKNEQKKDGIGKMRKNIENGMDFGDILEFDEEMHKVIDQHKYSLNIDMERIGMKRAREQFKPIKEPSHGNKNWQLRHPKSQERTVGLLVTVRKVLFPINVFS